MSSLKGYIPALARLLETTPGAIYERQRALTRAGLLDVSEGRGPGSGVKATDRAIALLLISLLSSEGLSDSERRAAAIAGATPYGHRKYCPFTGETKFGAALADLLVTGKADAITELSISRKSDVAYFVYLDKHTQEPMRSEFRGKMTDEPPIAAWAHLSITALRAIARDLQAMAMEELDP